MKRLLLVLTISVACVSASFAQSGDKPAPALVLKDTNGRTFRLVELKNKVVLVNFWATWCVPCRAEVKSLVRWQDKYKNSGLQIVGVTFPPSSPANVRSFIRTNKINYPVLFGTKAAKHLFDAGDDLPVSAIIRDGKVVALIKGVIFDDEFDEIVRPLLAR